MEIMRTVIIIKKRKKKKKKEKELTGKDSRHKEHQNSQIQGVESQNDCFCLHLDPIKSQQYLWRR